MEVTLAILMVVGALVPSVAKMMDSIAFRNRAAGEAEVIRAKRGERKGTKRSGGRHG
ncbi:hypothetical protein [Streptomyces sp. NBC_01614]|uniref:Uncharacterized protein n=1 Tax=Streptomyces machairae TaxID=3134109 RepID=A0ABU8UWY1_9ACTN